MKRVLIALGFCLFTTYAEAANRFWVGGTGTWDASTTTHWATSTGGGGGASAPVNGDNITFDGSSGTGTVTLDSTLAAKTFGSITADAMASLTLDWSVNNPSFSCTVFSSNGSGTRTINLGTATLTITGSGGLTWLNFNTSTNLTLTASSATIAIVPSSTFGNQTVAAMGSLNTTVGTMTFNGNGFGNAMTMNASGALVVTTVNITAPAHVAFPNFTITNAVNWTGTSANLIVVTNNGSASPASLTLTAAGGTAAWTAFRDITAVTHGITATNSFDMKGNTNLTITNPSVGGGGGRIIGG